MLSGAQRVSDDVPTTDILQFITPCIDAPRPVMHAPTPASVSRKMITFDFIIEQLPSAPQYHFSGTDTREGPRSLRT